MEHISKQVHRILSALEYCKSKAVDWDEDNMDDIDKRFSSIYTCARNALIHFDGKTMPVIYQQVEMQARLVASLVSVLEEVYKHLSSRSIRVEYSKDGTSMLPARELELFRILGNVEAILKHAKHSTLYAYNESKEEE